MVTRVRGSVDNTFGTVQEMKDAVGLIVGDIVTVKSYTATNNSGVLQFEIVPAATGTDDGGSYIDLAGSGLQAKQIFGDIISVKQFGAVGDGVTDDTVAIQKSIVAAGIGGTVLFSRTPYNVYVVNGQLKFKTGQHWVGEGGIDLSISGNSGTTVKLNSTTTSFIEAETKGSAITFGFRVSGIFFDTNNFADVAVDLTNTNYSMLEQFAARANKAGAAAVLFDSTGGQCYFNQLVMPRLIAQGVGGVCARFDNGANVNTIVGGKFGSSTRGVEFFNLSTGNTIVSGEFETITDKGAFVDSTSNKFISCYFEDMPIGIDITVNGNDTGILGNTYATSTIINVQDASKLGAQCDIHREPGGITGKLQFGPAKFSSSYLSGDTTLAYDPSLASATANAVLNLFRFTTTTGTRQFNIYKGDGSSTLAFNVNADTGQVRHNDILQGDDAGAVFRKTVRRNAAPTTGTWSQGDIVFSTTPSAGGFVGWVCTTAGSPGTWKTFGAIST